MDLEDVDLRSPAGLLKDPAMDRLPPGATVRSGHLFPGDAP